MAEILEARIQAITAVDFLHGGDFATLAEEFQVKINGDIDLSSLIRCLVRLGRELCSGNDWL